VKKGKLAVSVMLLLAFMLIMPLFVAKVESGISTKTLYAHAETTTIGSTSYYLHKSSSADGPALTLTVSAVSTGRKLMGRWVYSLNEIVSIQASTWTVTYRAMRSASASSVVAHGDIDILIRKSDNTIRATLATNVANSPCLTLTNIWQTLTGSYNIAAYSVVDQTDYLEIAYYIEVTTAQSSKSVRLLVDDNTLPLADQTKTANVVFAYPNQAPVASFVFSPSNPLVNDTVTFDASASYDPDGSIATYRWDFGDGNVTTVTNQVITHIYTTAESTVNYTVTLTVTDNEGSTGIATQIVPVTNPSILHVSLPDGTYVGPNPDDWLSQCWLLNITGNSATFTVRIDNIHSTIISYDTHLIICLNSSAYEYFDSLTVGMTTIYKADFTWGTPTPYGFTLSWENDVYPTWFSDIYNGVGTINPRSYNEVQVSVTFTNAACVAMHFDAYGSTDSPPPPTKEGHVTHNAHEKDSTVLFSPAVVVQYYLTVTSPYGTVSGQGWYPSGGTAYARLNTGIFDHGNGTRRVFLYWSGDASGTNYAQSDPITMDRDKTAIAVWKTQYYLTVTSPYGTTSGADWYDTGTNAYAGLNTGVVNHGNGTRHVFTNWAGDASGTNYASSDSIMMDGPKTAIAVWKTQHFLTVTSPYGITGGANWYDANTVAFASVDSGTVDHGNGTRRLFTNWSGDASGTNPAQSDPILMDGPKTAVANWKTQYRLIVRTSGLGGYVTQVYNGTNVLGTATDATPYIGWFDDGSLILLNIDSPIVDGSKRFVFTQWTGDAGGTSRPTSFTMNTAKDITASYKTQYQVTVTASPGGAVGGAFKVTYTQCGTVYTNVPRTTTWTEWVDFGTTVTVSEPQDTMDISLGARYKFDYYDPSASVSMDAAKTITLVYKTQYQVSFTQTGCGVAPTVTYTAYTDPTETVPFIVWVKAGSEIIYDFQDNVPGGTGIRYVISGIDPPSPQTVNGPFTVSCSYRIQYLLTVTSPYGTAGGQGWYESDATAHATLNTGVFDHGNGTRRVFISWGGDASGTNYAQSNPITMNGPKTAVAGWKTQYLLTVLTDPAGLTPQPTRNPAGEAGPPNGWWYDAPTGVTLTAQTVTGYDFNQWYVDGNPKGVGVNPTSVSMATCHTATAHYLLRQPPLTVSISPLDATIYVGQSVIFTPSVSGGTPPYTGKWYITGIPPIEAPPEETFTFTPPSSGTYYVYLRVTDSKGNTAQSEPARVIVLPRPVGGYSISFAKQAPTLQIVAYTGLIVLFGAMMSLKKRKRK